MELLWREYELIYQTYESYNDQVLLLKGWSVSIGIASLIAAYAKPISKYGRVSVFVAAFSAIPFWLTESLWKLFQTSYLTRILDIEKCFAEAETICLPGQIVTQWQKSYDLETFTSWVGVAFGSHVVFPHLFLLVVGICLAIWKPPADRVRDP